MIKVMAAPPLSQRLQDMAAGRDIDPMADRAAELLVSYKPSIAREASDMLFRAMTKEPMPYADLALLCGFRAYINLAAASAEGASRADGTTIALTPGDGSSLQFCDVPLYLDVTLHEDGVRVIGRGAMVVEEALKRAGRGYR